jgi:integrase
MHRLRAAPWPRVSVSIGSRSCSLHGLPRSVATSVRGEFTGSRGACPWELYVFGGAKLPDHSAPYSPRAVSTRYADMAARLGIKTHVHALRHYSATELLTAGVDLRTVEAGRPRDVSM